MSLLQRSPFFFKILLGLSAAFLFSGCAEKPTPPVFSLYGYQRLAVIPFDNQTYDRALAGSLADEMTSEIADLNAVPIIQASQVSAYLKSKGASPGDLLTNDSLRKGLGQRFQCDILLMGSADDYVENLKDGDPEREDGKWGFYTNRKVTVGANAKLVDVASGSLLWTEKNRGWSWHNTWNPLPIPDFVMLPDQIRQFIDLATLAQHRLAHKGDEEPATASQDNPNILIYKKSQYFAQLRQNAIEQTIGGIVADFRPHGGWTPQLRGNAQ